MCQKIFCFLLTLQFLAQHGQSIKSINFGRLSDENYDEDPAPIDSNENITLSELATHVDTMSKNMDQKLEALEEEMEKMRTAHDEKLELELERLKGQLEQQLENQRQDISTLLTSSGHVTSNQNDLNPCGVLVTLDIPVDLTHRNPGNSSTEQTCVYVIASPGGGPTSFTLVSLDLGHPTDGNDGNRSSLILHKLFQNQSSPLIRRLGMQDVGQEFSMDASSVILVFRSMGGQSFVLRGKDLAQQPVQQTTEQLSSELWRQVTANYLGRGVHDAGTFSHPIVSGRKYGRLERRHVIINSFPERRIRLSIDALDTQPNADFLAVYKFSRKKNKFMFLHRFSGFASDIYNLKFDADENEPMLLHFYSDSYMEESGFRISYSYTTSHELAASFWKSLKVENSFDQCGGLIPLLSHTELTYVNPGQKEDGQEEICVWILWSNNGGPTSLLLEDTQNFDNKTGPPPSLTIQTAVKFDDDLTTLPAPKISLSDHEIDQEIVMSDDSIHILTFVSSRAGQSFRLAMRDMGSFHNIVLFGTSNVSFSQLDSGDKKMEPKFFRFSSEPYKASLMGRKIDFFLIPARPGQTTHVTIDSVMTPHTDDDLRIYRFARNDKHFDLMASFKFTVALTPEEMAGSTFESEDSQPLLLHLQYDFSDTVVRGGFSLTYSYTNSGSSKTVEKLTFDPPQSETGTGTCGGSIYLSNNATELTYASAATATGGSTNLSIEICIWLLTARHNGAIGLTLTGENLDPSKSSLSLHKNSFLENFEQTNSTMEAMIQTPGQDRKRREMIIKSSVSILIFTTTAPGQGQGFKLSVRELGQVNYPSYLSRNSMHANLTSIPLGSPSGAMGTFSFPPVGGHSVAMLEEIVRQLFVLSPSPGGRNRLRLFVDHVNLNAGYDMLRVFQFSNSLKDFLPLRPSSLDQSRLTLMSGDTFIAEESEPIVIYYRSRYFMTGSGFSMSYSSQPLVTIEGTNLTSINGSSLSEVIDPTKRPIPCNEQLTLRRPMELIYKNWDNSTEQSTCVWVIVAYEGGPINFTLRALRVDDPSNTNLTSSSSLTLHQIFPNQTSSYSKTLKLEDIGQPISISRSVVLVTFQGWGGQGFHLDLEDLGHEVDSGMPSSNFLGPKQQQSSSTLPSSTFSWPSTAYGTYGHNERRYFVIKSMAHRNISLSIDFFSTESPHDTLSVFKFVKARNQFLFLQRYSGSFGTMTTAKFQGEEGQPMLQYFFTDSSVSDQGFRLSYSYRLPNETAAKIWRTTQVPHSFERCGGLVSLPTYTEIIYKNVGGSVTLNSTDDNSTETTTCVWLLYAKNGGKIGLELDSQDFIGGQATHGNLTVQTGLGLNFLKVPRQITSEDEGQEIETEDDTYALLVFTCKKGQSFHLGLRELNPRRIYSSNTPEFTMLKKPPMNSNITAAQFAYPATPGNYYVANEHRFILVPGLEGKFINLSVHYVDTASSGDVLKVYKFLASQKTFQYYGRFSGRLGEMSGHNFFGESGQNFLLYFSTNSYLHGRGFIVNYSYKNSTTKFNEWESTGNSSIGVEVSGPCGGLISLKQETTIAYTNKGERRGEEICVWIVTGSNEGVIGHTLLAESNFDNLTDILSIQKGFVAQTFTISHLIQAGDLNQEHIHSDHTLAVIFKSQVAGHGFRLRVLEYGVSSSVVEIHPAVQLGHLIRLKGFEAGSYFHQFPPTVPGDGMEKKRLFVTIEPAAGQVVTLHIDNLTKDPVLDFLNVYKFSKVNHTFVLLQRFRGSGSSVDVGLNYFGAENEPLLLIYSFGGRRLGSQFTISYDSQSPNPNQNFRNETVDNSTSAVTDWMETFNPSRSCGGMVVTSQSAVEYQNEGGKQETCIWVIVAPLGGPMTWTLLNASNLTDTTLTIQQEIGDKRAIVSRPILPASLGQPIPVKSDFAVLILNSIGGAEEEGRGQSFKLVLRDMGTSTIVRPDGVKVMANYVGGWSGQNYGTYAYPSPCISSSSGNRVNGSLGDDSGQYGSQERRHVIVRCLAGKFLRVSIDFVSTDETDDYLEIFKFSNKDHRFVFLQRYTGHLGYNLKDSVFDGDLGQPFFLYFSSDNFFQKKGFKISYWYHDPRNETEVDQINKNLDQQPSFASDYCRKISSCNECVRKRCQFTGQIPNPCRAGGDLQDFDTPHKFQPPLATILECQQNAGIKDKNKGAVLTKLNLNSNQSSNQLTSLEIAGIVAIILIVLIVLVIVAFAMYARSCLDVSTTSGPDGPILSISERKNIENIRLVELQ